MKKIVLMSAVAVMAFMFTSCKKDWNCTCDVPVFGPITTTIKDSTKKEAKEACDKTGTYQGYSVSCSVSAK